MNSCFSRLNCGLLRILTLAIGNCLVHWWAVWINFDVPHTSSVCRDVREVQCDRNDSTNVRYTSVCRDVREIQCLRNDYSELVVTFGGGKLRCKLNLADVTTNCEVYRTSATVFRY